MTVGASKAATTITHKPALAPSPQLRPAPTARALRAEPAAQRGPFGMPTRGPNPTAIDIRSLSPADWPPCAREQIGPERFCICLVRDDPGHLHAFFPAPCLRPPLGAPEIVFFGNEARGF